MATDSDFLLSTESNETTTERIEEINFTLALYNTPSIIYLLIMLIVGGVGNWLIPYVYGCRMKKRITPMNYFVIILSLLNLVTCLTVTPLMILYDFMPLLFVSDIACKVLRYIYNVTMLASSFTLVAIAVDHYRRICYPISSQLTVKQVKVTAAILVSVAVVLCIPVIIIGGTQTEPFYFKQMNRTHCNNLDEYENTIYPYIYSFYLFVILIMTITITVVCYGKIWRKTRHSMTPANNRRPFQKHPTTMTSINRKSKPNVKKVFLITLVFILSFVPCVLVIAVLMVTQMRDDTFHPVVVSFLNIGRRSYLLSSSLNPFIVWYCNHSFRAEVRSICCLRHGCCRRGGAAAIAGGRRYSTNVLPSSSSS